ncbi:MAG TPA: AAA family ATPase, partial [Candidatus Acidoferrum sp.]|nr:AAA family ATPase [Candidatus Acidoferrum sp.]
MSDSSLVMKGLLREFNLADVLQVVSMSRQFTAIELRRLDGQRQGVIWIKSGHVIAAQRGNVQGRRAFYELLRSIGEMFVVWRLQDPPSFNPPLGRLPELLTNADWSRRPEGSHSGPRPMPLPPPPRLTPAQAQVVSPVTVDEVQAVEDVQAPAAPNLDAGTMPFAMDMAAMAPRLSVVTSEPRPRRRTSSARSGVVVAICSPKGGVGKTTIALNLSVSLAQRGMKTLLVDADINGDQLALLDARDRVAIGVHDILDRPEALDEAVRDTASPNLRFLPASGPDLDLTQIEGSDHSEAWRTILDSIRARADIVMVDCPAG